MVGDRLGNKPLRGHGGPGWWWVIGWGMNLLEAMGDMDGLLEAGYRNLSVGD